MINSLNKVINNDLCSGCGACTFVSNQLVMKLNKHGYNRPIKINSSAEIEGDEQIFKNICPGLNLDVTPIKKSNYDYLWGQIEDINIGYSKNEEIRNSGSSGGVISALSKYLVDSKKVDFVINVSAGNNLDNVTSLKDNEYNFNLSAGSRYSPASPCTMLTSLDKDKTYAFVGKPCDVAAVHQLREQVPHIKHSIKYLISFMCAGTPSQKGTDDIIRKLGEEPENVTSIKYRGDGWPGYTKIQTKDKKSFQMTYNDAWGKILNKYLQTRCKICVDGIGEFADIVCADAWDCDENGYPIFEEKAGQSLVVCRTEVGRTLQEQAQQDQIISLKPFDKNNLKNMQPFQFYRRSSVLSRLLAFKFLGLKTPKYKGFHILKAAIKGGVIFNIKSFLGLVARRKKIIRTND